MSDQYDGEQYADSYQDDGYIEDDSIPGDSETAETWQGEPAYGEEPGYLEGLEEGLETNEYANDAGIARDIVQGQWDIQAQAANDQAVQTWRNEVEAAELNLGRPISEGEWAYIQWESQQPDSHLSVENALIQYHNEYSKTERMANSLHAYHDNLAPEYVEVLSGPDDNYGCAPGTPRTSHEFRAARDAWSLQQQQIARGEYGYTDE